MSKRTQDLGDAELRLRVVEETLKSQGVELARLRSRLESRAPAQKVRVPVVRLLPPKEQYDSGDGEPGSMTLADSRHEPMHFYHSGLRYLKEGKTEQAIVELEEFLDVEPNHIYADRALYLIGEAHSQAKEYGLAMENYRELQTRFPYSFKLSQSYYQRMDALLKMKMLESANIVFHELQSRFPSDPYLKKGKLLLAEYGASNSLKQTP